MHIYDKKKKTKIKDWLCREKYKTGKIGEVYAWNRNMLIVLNIILCWFCSNTGEDPGYVKRGGRVADITPK